jgi:hypothetical protein
MRLRAAIGLAAYQSPNPTPPRTETFVGPIGYAAPKTVEEARSAILALGERLAKCEISVEAHDSLISGLRAYLGDKAVEQQRALDRVEDSLRSGAERP